MALVTLEMAKAHCRVTDPRQDADVQRFADQASAVIIDYLKDRADPAWTIETLPLPVQLAILLLTQYLYRKNRGDDSPERGDDPHNADKGIWAEIDPILVRFRDPAFR